MSATKDWLPHARASAYKNVIPYPVRNYRIINKTTQTS
jgi:hypothetical protein